MSDCNDCKVVLVEDKKKSNKEFKYWRCPKCQYIKQCERVGKSYHPYDWSNIYGSPI